MKKAGPTGQFPNGMLNATDQGQLRIKVGIKDGAVMVDFGTFVEWIGFDPQGAADFGMLVIKHARNLAKMKGEVLEITL